MPTETETTATDTLSKDTIEKLEQLSVRIGMEHPGRFNMFGWFWNSDTGSDCGTSGCIAGWACVMFHESVDPALSFKDKVMKLTCGGLKQSTRLEATKLLGLTPGQAERLFYTNYWPLKLKSAYNLAMQGGRRQCAMEIAQQRIAHFIQTGGKE